MPDPTDPRAVADDPSGIVQQMPEGAGDVLAPCPFCGAPAEIVHIDGGELAGGSCVTCTKCLACSNVEFEFKENFVSNWNRRATEADLRAEVERLRLAVQHANDHADAAIQEVERLRGLLWYAWSEFNAIRARSGAPLSHDGIPLVAEDWWNAMTDAFGAAIGDDAQTPWPSREARSALYPETDGGQDAPADS